jgi:hypothetical protein
LGEEQLTGLLETMEILADSEATKAIRAAEAGEGNYCDVEDLED